SLWSRPASGNLVMVEIDSNSLHKLNSWPWSRAFHAAVIQRLSQAGAATIAFDIDFSNQSDPDANAQVANAIAQSKSTLVLPPLASPLSPSPIRPRPPAIA